MSCLRSLFRWKRRQRGLSKIRLWNWGRLNLIIMVIFNSKIINHDWARQKKVLIKVSIKFESTNCQPRVQHYDWIISRTNLDFSSNPKINNLKHKVEKGLLLIQEGFITGTRIQNHTFPKSNWSEKQLKESWYECFIECSLNTSFVIHIRSFKIHTFTANIFSICEILATIYTKTLRTPRILLYFSIRLARYR